MDNMILNQNLNFKGNLYVDGINLPKKKLKQVASLYFEKTNFLGDLYIKANIVNCENGKIHHFTNIIPESERFDAAIFTSDFKKMFEKYSPKYLSDILVRFTKIDALQEKIAYIERNIKRLKMLSSHNQSRIGDSFNVIAEGNRKRILTLEKELDSCNTNLNRLCNIKCPEEFNAKTYGDAIFYSISN